jgi:hypothetical protein
MGGAYSSSVQRMMHACMHACAHAQADAIAASADDKASAAKNLGMAHRRQAEGQATLEARMRGHIASLGHFATALTFGTLCKGTAWWAASAPKRLTRTLALSGCTVDCDIPGMHALKSLHAWA